MALGAGLGSSESALPPPPQNVVWGATGDSGSKLLMSPLLDGIEEEPCELCAARSATDLTPLGKLDTRPQFHIDSTAAYVFDQSCGEVLYSKNENRVLPPASLTKMMTALVAADHVEDLDQPVQIEISGSTMAVRTGSSIMGLEPHMPVSMRDLLYGLMLPSGNDAALEIAEAVAGDQQAFVALMNKKALDLGLTGTRFANPHGLDDPHLYSTARDLVVLGEAMMAHPVLAQIARAHDYALPDGLAMRNGNRMLGGYHGTYGVKIGYTKRASHTIVVAAERDGRRVYASVLGSKVPYADATALLDWAFSQRPSNC